MHQLRLLNVDDFMILRALREGLTVTAIGQRLGLSQPAITQRIRKMEEAFAEKILEKDGRGIKLSTSGQRIARQAIEALSAFENIQQNASGDELKIGIRKDLADSWLFPAILMAKTRHPDVQPNIRPGSEEEIMQDLNFGRLDAVISHTSAAVANDHGIDVGLERHVFVATPSVAQSIIENADLANVTFIDRHSSLPSMRLFPSEIRMKIRFKSTWAVGSTQNVAKAVADGLGVGILPDFLAAPLLMQGRIEMILPDVELESAQIRLFHQPQSSNHKYFESLGEILRGLSISIP
ncbi:MAG: LysR family transcriptional regulator [Proteobacteria bacterium]|nr:LysR family transcriptional regulator [Pseudomonadota bacterium]